VLWLFHNLLDVTGLGHSTAVEHHDVRAELVGRREVVAM